MATAVMPEPQQQSRLRLKLHRKQGIAFQSRATELFYGGAAGGGKSHLFRVAAIAWCTAINGLQVYLFRRTFPDLLKNHMEGPSSFPVLIGDLVDRGLARIDWGKMQIRFANGSVIHLCHCQHEKDIYKYQGAEIHVLMIDELTHWTRKMYTFLRSRVRMVGIVLPLAYAGLFPRIMTGANPGGVGHNWVKQDFVTIARPLELTQMPPDEGGMLRQYVPARMEDNPTLLRDDPHYEDKLSGLGDPALVKAMKSGDWNIISGGMFDDIWAEEIHAIPGFAIPPSWYVDRSFDWGSSKPFSVGWWAESDGTRAPNGKHYPPGSLFRIGEWYGWNGKANEGSKMLAVDVAKGILEIERKARWNVSPGPADSAIFDTQNGMSIAKDMKDAGVTWTEADKSPGSRKNGWERMRKYLTAAKENRHDEPHLYVFDSCVHGFIRTVPVLPRDERNRDDVDTDAEDHAGDESRYRVSAPKKQAWRQSKQSIAHAQ